MNSTAPFAISTPGRICLFGEHQDYLRLPVIPAAISLRIRIEGRRRNDSLVRISLPDINSEEFFRLDEDLQYNRKRDYLKSVVNVLRRHGFEFLSGFDCEVRSRIPIQAGASSSSALNVCWAHFLTRMSEHAGTLTPEVIARYAHEAEVIEFNEPGGMMDHFSAAFGGVIVIDFLPEFKVEPISVDVGSFVLGDSMEPKDTQGVLWRVKHGVLEIARQLSEKDRSFILHNLTADSVARYENNLDNTQRELLIGTIRNHTITEEARRLLVSHPLDHHRFGDLLSQHHAILRDVQKISTPKIDRMLDAAMNAGAYGGKINGSGGGGCMFAYAPENPEQVAEAIERKGGKAYIISVDEGTRVDQ